jgi:hypothetical protein
MVVSFHGVFQSQFVTNLVILNVMLSDSYNDPSSNFHVETVMQHYSYGATS